MSKCRDCPRCTEPLLIGCILIPLRIVEAILMFIPRGLKKRCPECGHPLSWHKRDSSGRFHD